MSEQLAQQGAPNGESAESDVVDPTVGADASSDAVVEEQDTVDAVDADPTDALESTDSEVADEAVDVEAATEEPADQGSGDPVADFKAEIGRASCRERV